MKHRMPAGSSVCKRWPAGTLKLEYVPIHIDGGDDDEILAMRYARRGSTLSAECLGDL